MWKDEEDFCECGGILNFVRAEEDIMVFICEKCGEESYNDLP